MPATTVNRLLPITLRQLQVFLAIAKTESIGLAAESLTMSKSAVSQALSELETRLGVQLFDRNRGRIFLTAEGRRMMPQADEMLICFAAAMSLVRFAWAARGPSAHSCSPIF